MPTENDDEQQSGTPDPAPAPAPTPVLTLPPDAVRHSPEYRELERQRREDARAMGRIQQEAADIRAQAERDLQAAEAQRLAALNEQLQTVLGDDGMSAFNELAELSATDPVAAARRFKELTGQAPAQSGDGTIQPLPGAKGQTEGDTQVSGQQQSAAQSATPQPPQGNLSGDAPLGQGATTGPDWDGIAADADQRYAEVVKRNQDPIERARVTDRERGGGLMAWLEAAYIRGMKARGTLPRG